MVIRIWIVVMTSGETNCSPKLRLTIYGEIETGSALKALSRAYFGEEPIPGIHRTAFS